MEELSFYTTQQIQNDTCTPTNIGRKRAKHIWVAWG